MGGGGPGSVRAGPAHVGGWALPARLRPWTLCGRSQCMVPWPVRTRSFLTGGLGGRPASAPDPHCVPSPRPLSWTARGWGLLGGTTGEGPGGQRGRAESRGESPASRRRCHVAAGERLALGGRDVHSARAVAGRTRGTGHHDASESFQKEPGCASGSGRACCPDSSICRALGQRSLGQRVWGQPPPLGDPHLPP